MIEGNTLTCKKSLFEEYENNDNKIIRVIHFEINKKYVIESISGNCVILLKNDYVDYHFRTYIKEDGFYVHYLWDFFYTKEELRKLKLESIIPTS